MRTKHNKLLSPILALALIIGVNALTAVPSRANSEAGSAQPQVLRFPLEDGDELRVVYDRPETVYLLSPYSTMVSLRISTKMGKYPVGKFFNVNGKAVAVEIQSSDTSLLDGSGYMDAWFARSPGTAEISVKVGEIEKRIKLNICTIELKKDMTDEQVISILGFPSSKRTISLGATWDKQSASEIVDGELYFASWPGSPSAYAEHWYYDKYPQHFFGFQGRRLTKIMGIPLPVPNLD